ncbi:hypothetical protein KKA02_02320 [Patescibacteria group bacterium]|nr:hypothetical protein [Patescibacteria group bacterium]
MKKIFLFTFFLLLNFFLFINHKIVFSVSGYINQIVDESKSTGQVLQAQSNGTPFKFWRGVGSDYRKDFKQNPLEPEIVSYLENLAETNDLVNPVVAFQTVNNTREYSPWVYSVLREANPDIRLLEYTNFRNWAGGHFLKEEIAEEWYIHDPFDSRKIEDRVVRSGWNLGPIDEHNEWAYDMGNQDFIDFFVNRLIYVLSQGMDGFWFDSAGFSNYVREVKRYSDGKIVTPINPRTKKRYTIEEQREEDLNMAYAIRNAVDKAFPGGLSTSGIPIVLSPNIGGEIVEAEWELVETYGTAQSESGAWFSPKDIKNYSLKNWQQQVNNLQEAMKRNIDWLYMGKSYIGDNPWPGSSRLMFTYASALLGAGAKGDNFYFRYNYGGWQNWLGFSQDVGFGQGDFFKFPGSTNIYARWFSKALVLVNPSDKKETINPKITYQAFRDFSDNGGNSKMDWRGLGLVSSGSIDIPAYEAAILLTSQAPSVSCLTCSSSPLKSVGNANCDTSINISDFAIWKTEYLKYRSQPVSANNYNSDFNCDQKVTISDFAIWKTGYLGSR